MADESRQEATEVEEQEPHGTEEPIDWEARYKEAVAQSRKWEERAKANKERADEWDAATKRAESAEAELGKLRESAQHDADAKEVAKETGVPAHLLAFCADRESMEAFAKEYASDSKPPAAAPAPDSRVIRGGKQSTATRDKFASYFE